LLSELIGFASSISLSFKLDARMKVRYADFKSTAPLRSYLDSKYPKTIEKERKDSEVV